MRRPSFLPRALLLVLTTAGAVREAPAQSRLVVDPAPFVDITGTDSAGNVRVERPVGATRLPNGDIAIADAASGSIRFFTPNSRMRGQVGRLGDGPGEFRSLAWLGQCGRDSLVAWDITLHRLTIISATGRVLGQRQIPAADEPNGDVPAYLACSPAGTLAFLARPAQIGAVPAKEQFERLSAPLVVAAPGGRGFRAVRTVPVAEVAYTNGGWWPRPLGRSTQIAVAGAYIVIGTADSGYVQVLDPAGIQVRGLRFEVTPRKPTSRHLERAVDQMTMFTTGRVREGFRKTLLAIPPPRELPPYSAIFADLDESIWIVTSFPGDESTRIRGFTRAGAPLGELAIDRDLTVFEIGSDYVLASYEDADGEPHVVMYRLQRGPT